MLFLYDASSNELWTQRDDAKVIQVPGSLGIAGATLASCSTVFVDDVHSDARFHAMVDQFVLAGLRHDALQASAPYSLDTSRATKPMIALFSSALLGHDGAVLGVLQIAVPTALLPPSEVALYVRQTHLFGKLCCFYSTSSTARSAFGDVYVMLQLVLICSMLRSCSRANAVRSRPEQSRPRPRARTRPIHPSLQGTSTRATSLRLSKLLSLTHSCSLALVDCVANQELAQVLRRARAPLCAGRRASRARRCCT